MVVKISGLAVLLVCICIGPAVGQANRQTNRQANQRSKQQTKKRSPGIVHNGKYIGFVPKHRRAAAGILSQISQAETEAPPVPRAVEQASFESSIIDEGILGGCEGCAAGNCDGGCGQPRFFGSAEYLNWWTKDAGELSLATSSPTGTGQDQAGVLGQLDTTTLFGDELGGGSHSGGKFSVGFWLDPSRTQAIEVGYLVLGEETDSFVASNLNQPILARPFFNVQLNEPDSRLIAFPGLVAGNLNIESSSELQAFEILMRQPVMGFGGNAQQHYGYRYARLTESVRINESTVSLSGPTQDAAFELSDRFKTKSEFHGGQLGFNTWWHTSNPMWFVELNGKVAIGNTTSEATISGQTTVTPSGGTAATTNAGLLTQESNIGTFEWDEFSTIFEAGITLHRDLGCNMSASVGYSFLFWNDVARAGELIDSSVNPTQIPPNTLDGEARPRFAFDTADFWAQGIRLGLNVRY